MTKPTNSVSEQVGGNHYKGTPPGLEHWDVVNALGWDYFVGAATKYLWRLGKKEGEDPVEALKKSIQFLQKKIDIMQAEREAARQKTPSSLPDALGLVPGDIFNITGSTPDFDGAFRIVGEEEKVPDGRTVIPVRRLVGKKTRPRKRK